MKQGKSPQKKNSQTTYFNRAEPNMQYEFCLNGVRVAIQRLQDFWEEQKSSWKEIRDISDEEVAYSIIQSAHLQTRSSRRTRSPLVNIPCPPSSKTKRRTTMTHCNGKLRSCGKW